MFRIARAQGCVSTNRQLLKLLRPLPCTQVARAKALGGGHRPSSSRGGVGGGRDGDKAGSGGGAGEGAAMAFAVGLLDIAIPREDRVGGTFPRVMINDACIARAVQGGLALVASTEGVAGLRVARVQLHGPRAASTVQ